MPSTKGLEILLRNTLLTNEEWLRLLEARRDLVRPYLDKFTLPALGSLRCLCSGELRRDHEIWSDLATEAFKNYDSDILMRGIFCGTEHNRRRLGLSFEPESERHIVRA